MFPASALWDRPIGPGAVDGSWHGFPLGPLVNGRIFGQRLDRFPEAKDDVMRFGLVIHIGKATQLQQPHFDIPKTMSTMLLFHKSASTWYADLQLWCLLIRTCKHTLLCTNDDVASRWLASWLLAFPSVNHGMVVPSWLSYVRLPGASPHRTTSTAETHGFPLCGCYSVFPKNFVGCWKN